MPEDTNVRFKIGDEQYEIPPVDDFDMDEWQIVYDYAGLVLDDFAPVEDEDEEKDRQRRVSQPAFMRALLHIGYRRAHTDVKDAEIKKVTGAAKMTQLFDGMGEDDAGPPDPKPDPESAQKNSPGSNVAAPGDSTVSSAAPASRPETTGTPV